MGPLGSVGAYWPYLVGVASALVVFLAVVLRAAVKRRRVKSLAVCSQADALLAETVRIADRFRKEAPYLRDEVLCGLVARADREARSVLETARSAIAHAKKLSRRSPDGAAKMLAEVTATVAAAEEMFVAVDEAVREIRSLATGLLVRVESWWTELLERAARESASGCPVFEEAMRLTTFRLVFAADRLLVESDPFGVLADLMKQIEGLARVGHAVAVITAVCERVAESAAALPARLAEIDRSLPFALEALAELKAARPDQRWDGIGEELRSAPKESESLRQKFQNALALSRSVDRRFPEALRETVLAESALESLESRIETVLEQWSKLKGVPWRKNS